MLYLVFIDKSIESIITNALEIYLRMAIFNKDSFRTYLKHHSPLYQQGYYDKLQYTLNTMWFYLLCNKVLGYDPYPYTAHVGYCVTRLLNLEKIIIQTLGMSPPDYISHLILFPGYAGSSAQSDILKAMEDQNSVLMDALSITHYQNHIDYNVYFSYHCHIWEIMRVLRVHPAILT